MYLISGALLVATILYLVQGLPAERIVSRATGSLDSWISTESPLSRQLLLANIGSDGFNDRGAASGLVVASPSDTNPNCR